MVLWTIKCLILFSLFLSHGKDTVSRCEYSVLMKIGQREVTGICILETDEDGNIAGTMINEFGIKAFDFTCSGGKTRILNVMEPLDKWYIRRRLRKDFDRILLVLDNSGAYYTRSFTSYVFTPLGN